MPLDLRCERLTKIIGLTGPTGAGKTTVSQLLEKYGCYVIDCDKIAHEITTYHVDCLKALCYAFGNDILNDQGFLNRPLLAQRAFSDKEQTQKLNQVTHPYIIEEIQRLIQQYKKYAKVIVLDAPLLFEAGLQYDCDKTVSVLAPLQIRMDRIINRDGISQEQARLRICAQPDDRFYISQSDIILDGTQTEQVLSNQITTLLEEIW